MGKYCRNCGAQMQNDDLFCAVCGTKSRIISQSEPSGSVDSFQKPNLDVNAEENFKSERKSKTGSSKKPKKWIYAVVCIFLCAAVAVTGIYLFPKVSKNSTIKNFTENITNGLELSKSHNKESYVAYVKDNNLYLVEEEYLITEQDLTNFQDPAIEDQHTEMQIKDPLKLSEGIFNHSPSTDANEIEAQTIDKNNFLNSLTYASRISDDRIFIRLKDDQSTNYGPYYTFLENGVPLKLEGVLLEPLKKCSWDKEDTLLVLDCQNQLIKYDIPSGDQQILATGVNDFMVDTNNLSGFNKILYLTDTEFKLLQDGQEKSMYKPEDSRVNFNIGNCTFLTWEDDSLYFIDVMNDKKVNLGYSFILQHAPSNKGEFFYTQFYDNQNEDGDNDENEDRTSIFFWNGEEPVKITDDFRSCFPSYTANILLLVEETSENKQKIPYIWDNGSLKPVKENGKEIMLPENYVLGMSDDGKNGLLIAGEEVMILDPQSGDVRLKTNFEEEIINGYIDNNQYLLCTQNGLYKGTFDNSNIQQLGEAAEEIIYIDNQLVIGVKNSGNYICYKNGRSWELPNPVHHFFNVLSDGSILYTNVKGQLIKADEDHQTVLGEDVDLTAIIDPDDEYLDSINPFQLIIHKDSQSASSN